MQLDTADLLLQSWNANSWTETERPSYRVQFQEIRCFTRYDLVDMASILNGSQRRAKKFSLDPPSDTLYCSPHGKATVSVQASQDQVVLRLNEDAIAAYARSILTLASQEIPPVT
jgi:hypothetical protein